MKLSEFKEIVNTVDDLKFELSNGESVPSHYHVTEVGYITKNFIDCGGTIREEKAVNFQLWYSNDFDHKLEPKKMLDIINLSENKLGIGDFEIEVEYQSDTIGKYGLEFNGNTFVLTSKMTDCLAPDNCGIPQEKTKINLSDLVVKSNNCSPNSGCC
jgi:uncharacterized protein DUF6428